MAKPKMPRVQELEEDYVHYGPPAGADMVTLCGITDWLGRGLGGVPTQKKVTCNLCNWIVDYCRTHTP